jgi:hypothetical protein
VLLNETVPNSATVAVTELPAIAAGTSPKGIAIQDFDGDGRPELMVGNGTSTGTVSIYRNTQIDAAASGSATATLIPNDLLFRNGFE